MTAKKNTGPVQLGEVMGDLLAQAQARRHCRRRNAKPRRSRRPALS